MSALPPSQRANVLRAYRELLSLAARLPAEQRGAALAEARAGVRANAGESDPGAASEQLKRLWARVGFLRMVRIAPLLRPREPHRQQRAPCRVLHARRRRGTLTDDRAPCAAPQTLPRRPGDRARGSGIFVLRDGELVPGSGESAGTRVATGILDMNEARARHNALLKRQHFGRMPGSMEPF